MCRTIGCFLFLDACMAPSGTMKASPRPVLTQGPIVPVSEVRFVFSNRNLSLTSGQCMFKRLQLPLCVYNFKLSLKVSKKASWEDS